MLHVLYPVQYGTGCVPYDYGSISTWLDVCVYDIKQQKLEHAGWVLFALALFNSFDEVP